MFWIIPDFHWLNSMFGQIPSRNLDSWRFYPDLWLLYPHFFGSNKILHSWSTPCSLNIKSPVFDAHPPDFLLSKGCSDFSPNKGHACSTPRATLWRGWWRWWLCRCRYLRKLNIHSHFNFWPLSIPVQSQVTRLQLQLQQHQHLHLEFIDEPGTGCWLVTGTETPTCTMLDNFPGSFEKPKTVDVPRKIKAFEVLL